MSLRKFYWSIKEFLSDSHKKPFSVIAGQDGFYEVRENPLGRIVIRKEVVQELDPIQPGFQFNLPKIPGILLETTLAFFRDYCQELESNEVMVTIYYDLRENQYLLECPYQSVNKTRIFAEFDNEYMHNERYVQVLQIHSHNSMHAFFSSIDDADEKAYMLYSVVGRLDQVTPEMLLRVGTNGQFIELPLEYIFEDFMLEEKEMDFPQEWKERITIL
ncbi:hypothetical protein [Aneurinibacillus tyrosinisolvens]|uniref:hypothetical protein n=1 Tax=Aneurinibacillus tyrosinisolvens TaxID=1443435 RepID=UPI00063FB830|nr:hypothetical protein [Aneurinibacillus tyrosinisolvens]